MTKAANKWTRRWTQSVPLWMPIVYW